MAVCLIFLDRLADAGQNAYLYLEAFTRKIIALIKGRVKYFFTQLGNFKVMAVICKTSKGCLIFLNHRHLH